MRTILAVSLLLNSVAWGQDSLRIPNRQAKSLFEGEPGIPKSEVHFNPATGTVMLKLLVEDPHGYFIPGIRRESFVVYENGVRQTNANVEIEHAPVSLALLTEYGGRHAALNLDLRDEISTDTRALLQIIGRQDKVAIWAYADRVTQLASFSLGGENLDAGVLGLKPPEISETNLYDAVISALRRIRPVPGRKAIVLISSGVDTFSKATLDDALKAARSGTAPLYVIDIGPALRNAATIRGASGFVTSIDWKTAERNFGEIARASGGRLYSASRSIDLPAIYGDMMENVKVRYVITYKSSGTASPNTQRIVTVELVNPRTGRPLEIVDGEGRLIRPTIIPRQAYVPDSAGK
ncbi:MAG: hypothetical protein QOJ99_2758 [Bryobacterales bacterium]|jgi:VWFA-related protein|nr:hypothetical protein [Bryobacterales bacterium]